MRTMTKTLGWLVVAAALTFGFSACSSDDDAVAEKPTVPTGAVSTVHVSVGAGIGGEGTRSAVDYNESTRKRTLQFSEGDKLYVFSDLSDGETVRVLAGYLDIDPESIDNTSGSTATFSGDLTVRDVDGNKTFYDFGNATDPLAVCRDYKGIEAHLVSGSFVDGFFDVLYNDPIYHYVKCIATGNDDNVSTLMTTALKVVSTTYSTDDGFTDFYGFPIINCTINGVKDNNYLGRDGGYVMKLLSSETGEEGSWVSLENNNESFNSNGGTLSFAICPFDNGYYQDEEAGEEFEQFHSRFYKLCLYDPNEQFGSFIEEFPLGQKAFEFGKVYNVTRNALLRMKIAEDLFIYYFKGESWENAIENHSDKNSGFWIDDNNKVRYGEENDESSKYVCYGDGDDVYSLDPSNSISNEDTYNLSDVGPEY